MNPSKMNDVFATAFRSKLITQVHASRGMRRRKWLIGAGLGGVTLFAGTAAAAATGLLSLPGTSVDTPKSSAVTGSYVGSQTVSLGAPPEGVSGVSVSLHCLTPGHFDLPGGGRLVCTDADFAGTSTRAGFDAFIVPISDIKDGDLRVSALGGAKWELAAHYVNSETLPWSVNADGQTYGVVNDNGTPDLVAAIATNGTEGYVHREDLEPDDGASVVDGQSMPRSTQEGRREINVYASDGVTFLGTFVIGN
jgi:hypothetical protein